MTRATATATLALATALIGATAPPQRVGFAKLGTVISAHPLAPMLAQYDRAIGALRRTSAPPGLVDPARDAQRSATIVAHRTSTAAAQVHRLATAPTRRDRDDERAALADIEASQRVGDSSLASYRDGLARETNDTQREYAGAIAQRNARALSAREQQLREDELTLAFDLARRDAGQRLALRLQLQHLHLTSSKRTTLQRRLMALNRAEQAALAVRQRRNAAILAAYRASLAREGAEATASLAAQTDSKAAANLAIRLGVSRVESHGTNVPDLRVRMRSFAVGYSAGRTADAVEDALRTSARELPQRFAALARTDRQSAAQAAEQIRTLERDRRQLYQSILAHVARLAERLARERGLRRVVLTTTPPRGSVDLTAGLAAMVRRF
ncbi:MAG: hypothetical protein JO030_01910 [Candidatus Eremiobacteraeota bacterium]|nr:hypothetical protein [Candidatus Eremiobacteraeota bacterium]